MTIQVKFFASLRETLGRESCEITDQSGLTVHDIWRLATDAAQCPVNTLCAINMEYTRLDAVVQAGDEVAFFPPVTGG